MKTTPFTLLLLIILSAAAAAAYEPPFSCAQFLKSFQFCNTTLPVHDRVRDLVSRLNLDEKISQLVSSAPAIPRLGIPAYEWWSEALHGVSGYGPGISFTGPITSATSFPQVILSASTFDSHLWYKIGQAVGKEARAVYNAGQAKGMTFWAPNINIFRDPRWGRGQETPGEDPLVAGKYAVAFVRGIQGDAYDDDAATGHRRRSRHLHGPDNTSHRHLQASACCKHFTAYDLDHWKAVSRFAFDAQVTKQDLADTYQPPFKKCVEGGKASGIMCAYNRVNGIPNCADHNLLTKTARLEWGFNGYITSDCDAVSIIHDIQKYARLPEDAVADVLKAGMDVNCGSYLMNYTKSAINQKKVTESQVDRALHNLFAVRMRLGLFDGDPKHLPFGNIGPEQVCTDEHHQLALDAARNGIVLLKNADKLLPLPKLESQTSSLAVIGPNAYNAFVLLGNYQGPPCKPLEIYKALQGYVKDALYHSGCNAVNCTSAAIGEAVETATRAEHVVLVMGLDQHQETEDHDREALTLPGRQEELIKAVAADSKKPVVLVLVCGGPVDVSFAKDDPKIGSIIWAGYPGEAGATALAEIIFGEHNPGGKLPVTWYPKDFAIKVPMTDMRMRPETASGYPGRTYRFYTGEKVFEFGYGLSYSKYSYDFVTSTPNTVHINQSTPNFRATDVESSHSSTRYRSVPDIGVDGCERLRFSAHLGVKNGGDLEGTHPVLLFVRPVGGGVLVKQLVGFESVSLEAGQRVEVEFVVSPCEHLSSANEDGVMVIEEGHRQFVVEDAEYPVNIVL